MEIDYETNTEFSKDYKKHPTKCVLSTVISIRTPASINQLSNKSDSRKYKLAKIMQDS